MVACLPYPMHLPVTLRVYFFASSAEPCTPHWSCCLLTATWHDRAALLAPASACVPLAKVPGTHIDECVIDGNSALYASPQSMPPDASTAVATTMASTIALPVTARKQNNMQLQNLSPPAHLMLEGHHTERNGATSPV